MKTFNQFINEARTTASFSRPKQEIQKFAPSNYDSQKLKDTIYTHLDDPKHVHVWSSDYSGHKSTIPLKNVKVLSRHSVNDSEAKMDILTHKSIHGDHLVSYKVGSMPRMWVAADPHHIQKLIKKTVHSRGI